MRALAFSGGKDSMACLHLCRDRIDVAIFVDTGKTYPETWKTVEYANTIVPVIVASSKQQEQNDLYGLPADVVPIDYTDMGQTVTGARPIKIQSYIECCFYNISHPLFAKAKELGATSIIYGQRMEESHKSPARNGTMIDGIMRLHPIENWSTEEVLNYLSTVMDVPDHYFIKHSSLDCYDCTAFRKDSKDRVAYTKERHPELYRKYLERMESVRTALEESGYVEK